MMANLVRCAPIITEITQKMVEIAGLISKVQMLEEKETYVKTLTSFSAEEISRNPNQLYRIKAALNVLGDKLNTQLLDSIIATDVAPLTQAIKIINAVLVLVQSAIRVCDSKAA